MSSRSFQRALALVATPCLVALAGVSSAAPAAAATGSGTLFGLGPTAVFTIDPVTGAETKFVDLPTVDAFPGASYYSLASDAAGHRLFTERTVYTQQPDGLTSSYQVVTVNTADATAAPTVSGDMASGLTQLVYDSSSQRLFGLTNMYPFQLVSVDPDTGAQAVVAGVPGIQPLQMTVAPAKHVIYMPIEDFSQFPAVNTIATFDTATGAVSQSQPLATGIFALEYDAGSGTLYGKTFCCPGRIVKVNPTTGAETDVAGNLGLGSGITIDPASHSIYMTDDEFGAYGLSQFIQAVDLRTGALSTSTAALPSTDYIGSLAFESPPITITPQSIEADTRAAIASGAISNAGVGTALMSELTQAEAALARGQCVTASNLYQAFVNNVSAQSGKSIAASTASQLIGEAQYLMTSCS